jgi:ZIP family zinc transporter
MSAATEAFVAVAGENLIVQALVGGLVIAALNLLGASLVLVWRDPSERPFGVALG